jgi:hypothetical protein
MWLHITAFSTFPFRRRRTGEGNFYQQQHHQHRRFFLSRQAAAIQLNSNGQGRVFSFFLRFTRPDIARYPRCFVSSFHRFLLALLLFAFLFQLASFSLCFFARLLLFRYDQQDTNHTKQRQKYITHTKIAEKTVCRFHAVFTFKPIFYVLLRISDNVCDV